MKMIALCFLMLASAPALFAQAPLSGYDVFEVTTDATTPSTGFEIESIGNGKTYRGKRGLTPVLNARDLVKFDLAMGEIGTAPCPGVSAVFRPAAVKKLRAMAARTKATQVLIVINAVPRSTFEVTELIRLIEQGGSLFVYYRYETPDEHLNAKAMVQQVKSGQWKEPKQPAASP